MNCEACIDNHLKTNKKFHQKLLEANKCLQFTKTYIYIVKHDTKFYYEIVKIQINYENGY